MIVLPGANNARTSNRYGTPETLSRQEPRQRDPTHGTEKPSPIGDPHGVSGVILIFVPLSSAQAKSMTVASIRMQRTARFAFIGLTAG
jgi:hypothetical protein